MIAMIAAMAANRVIGRDGEIPWHLPEDMERFRKRTMGHVVVMGRRTWEEIGHPLPGRMNYLVSSSLLIQEENMNTVTSLAEAIRQARENHPDKTIFLCGGASIYQEGMALADRIYLAVLDREIPGDTYFPELSREYRLVERESGAGMEFRCYQRESPVPFCSWTNRLCTDEDPLCCQRRHPDQPPR